MLCCHIHGYLPPGHDFTHPQNTPYHMKKIPVLGSEG